MSETFEDFLAGDPFVGERAGEWRPAPELQPHGAITVPSWMRHEDFMAWLERNPAIAREAERRLNAGSNREPWQIIAEKVARRRGR